MKVELERWEGEGGALPPGDVALTGSLAQIELAQRIRITVREEFDRVSDALLVATRRQSPANRLDAEAVIAILEEELTEVMSINRAGYFIREWLEINGRVRKMLAGDARYTAVRATREDRRSPWARGIPSG